MNYLISKQHDTTDLRLLFVLYDRVINRQRRIDYNE